MFFAQLHCSQHDNSAFLHSLYHKVHLHRCEFGKNLPHLGHLESVKFTSIVCGIRCEVKHKIIGSGLLNSPVFRYHQIALGKMRKLLTLVMITTVAAAVAWTTITFFGDSTMLYTNPETNVTAPVEIPRLQIKAYYPWNPNSSKMTYFMTIGFQFYYLLFSMVHSNSSDVLFCSWVLFACEQLQHLKVKNSSIFKFKIILLRILKNMSLIQFFPLHNFI